ncbi:trimeric intracellular cation channel family protein [Pyrobaculum calidifontis]|uniref:Glycine transporter domain-containing protein n=1 Tax=Pyrobaculum calidifontis (strain DSM 21063 / JCM 11548 / VA1) TaxID=410359 RepID=A3MWT3_PYRCJ|nr:trimeric intracellular cation channel family protein [Pyrobaculum calidifontis]ABO09100.1 protein of unknown function UPF0126 [Pyrobaculum calidifontis JCM 11548]
MHAEAVLEVLNYVGIVAFAVSGALKAGEKNMDLLGVITLGFSTALAGGIIRDVLLGRVPPVNLIYLPYSLTAVAASVATFILYPRVRSYKDLFLYPDAVGLGAFSAIGADVAASFALKHGYSASESWFLVAALASITAAGGGVVRDVLAGEIPQILRREIYATAAAVGGIIYLATLPAGREAAMFTTIASVTAIRIVSLWRRWELPKITTPDAQPLVHDA